MKNSAGFILSLFSICLFLNASPGMAQANRNWLWAQSAGGIHGASGTTVTSDATGNVIAAGAYKWDISFGATTLLSPDSNSADFEQNGYVVKYDASGNVKWARAITGDNTNYVTSVSTEANGNIYVSGYFSSHKLTFDNISVNNSAYGKFDIFLAKYDPDGKILWAKSFGGSLDDEANAVKTDAKGNVYIAGFFSSSTLDIGIFSIYNANTTTRDIFIAKFDNTGQEIWASSYGGTEPDAANALAVDAKGHIYLAGYFRSNSITIGSATLNNDSSTTTEDIFIAKFDDAGKNIWAVRGGGGLVDVPYAMTNDASGNIYIVGSTTSGLVKLGNFRFAGKGSEDAFVAKLDTNGIFTWAATLKGESIDHATGVGVDASGNIFVTGYFNSAALSIESETLYYTGGYDMFIAKYNNDGSLDFAKSVGEEGGEKGNALAIDKMGNILVAGNYSSEILAFMAPPKIFSDGTSDMFVAKMDNKNAAGLTIHKQDQKFSIFPNPTTGIINISQNDISAGFCSFEIFNIFGERMASTVLRKGADMQLNITGYAPGMYYIKWVQAGKTETMKIIKM